MKFITYIFIITLISSSILAQTKEKLGTMDLDLKYHTTTSMNSNLAYRLKYNSPSCRGLYYSFGYYQASSNVIKEGITLDNAPDTTDTAAFFGEIYLKLKVGSFNAQYGKGLIDTPFTANTYSQVIPNFYEYSAIRTKNIKKTEIEIINVTSMAYGSNSFYDYYLIGEQSNSAGAGASALNEKFKFINIGRVADGVYREYGGIITGIKTTLIPNTTLELYNFHINHLISSAYAHWVTKASVGKSFRVVLGAQSIYQEGLNALILKTGVYGAKIGLESNNGSGGLYFNYSMSLNDTYYNPWGSDPLWTSTMFNRNGYRSGVTGYSIKYKYMNKGKSFLRGITFGANYALYSKSSLSTATQSSSGVDMYVGYVANDGLYIKYLINKKVSETSNRDYDLDSKRVLLGYRF